MRMKHDGINFYYAKNGPSDPSVTNFLQQVQKILYEDDSSFISGRILSVSLSACVHKFKGRIIETRKALIDTGIDLRPGSGLSNSHTLSSRLPQWNYLNDEQIPIEFFEDLGNLDSPINAFKSNINRSISLSRKACLIGICFHYFVYLSHCKFSNSVLGSGSLLESHASLHARIQKLGAYYGAAWNIAGLMRRPELLKMRKRIAFQEVSTSSLLWV